jgi:hypothetical protein
MREDVMSNPSVNRSSESPAPPSQNKLEPAQPEILSGLESPSLLAKANSEVSEAATPRKQPIPPPSHPRQYRAIGLIQAKYERSPEYLNRGILITEEGSRIEAVILGRAISLVKKHLDLEQSHLWVVYPRTRPDNDQFHVQIIGVWEPEKLHSPPSSSDAKSTVPSLIHHGYFSVRGEVIFASPEKQKVIVKIRQAPKNDFDKPKFFKLKLQGNLPERPVSRFWDLQLQLKGDILIIQEATDMGLIKKKPFQNTKQPFRPTRSERPKSFRPLPKGKPSVPSKPSVERKFSPKLFKSDQPKDDQP